MRTCKLRRALHVELLESRTLLTAAVALTTTNELLLFDTDTPDQVSAPVSLGGLRGGEMLLGIDYRPATGQLYGISNANRLLTIDPDTGMTTPVGMPFSTPLRGSRFGIDFNPVVDRLRIVSDAEQNLRIDPNTGQVAGVDMPLAYSLADFYAFTDPNIVAAAYINNFPGATETLLFVMDSTNTTVVLQAPPNDGILNTVGWHFVNTSDMIGFDIQTTADENIGFAIFSTGEGETPQLYRVELYQKYQAELVGTLNTDRLVQDLAIVLAPPGSPGGPARGLTADVIVGLTLVEAASLPSAAPLVGTLAFTGASVRPDAAPEVRFASTATAETLVRKESEPSPTVVDNLFTNAFTLDPSI